MLLKKVVVACVKKREEEREKKRAFLKNGGLVLEMLVASCNGRPIPIRTFSYQELILATNSFDPCLILHRDRQYKIYKGSFEGRIFSIYMYDKPSALLASGALTNMAISAKVSAHKNTLKLVGCCLETSFPSLMYEYAQNGVLADRIYIFRRQGTPIVWQSRLKIARQIAHVIAYLHTGFSRPIIHRDIQPRNIFLDQHDVPKLRGFSLSISIPEGKTHVEDEVYGTMGFLCPSYFTTRRVTEKSDVFGFGMVLLQLLTGQDLNGLMNKVYENDENLKDYLRNSTSEDEICDPAILAEEGGVGVEEQLQAVPQLEVDENKNILKDYLRNSTSEDEICDPAILAEEGGVGVEEHLPAVLHRDILKDYLRNSTSVDEICDPAILAEEGGVGVEEQLQAVLQLVLTCIEYDPEIRPTMVDITKELRRIERSIA